MLDVVVRRRHNINDGGVYLQFYRMKRGTRANNIELEGMQKKRIAYCRMLGWLVPTDSKDNRTGGTGL